ncbi:MAG: YebC/PmpR family DNA-binding transcriptional regulator [bacterium]
MSGHSKWAGIKHKKGALDAQRGKLFSKLNKEIMLAAKTGGKDPDGNARLRLAIQKAREANMPGDNIKKAIARGVGEIEGGTVEEITYECYGPSGVALLVEGITDNKKRTSSEIRHILSKGGGNMGEAGCVLWMFKKLGVLQIEKPSISEDSLFDIGLSLGCEDIKTEDNEYEVYTDVGIFEKAKEELKNKGANIKYAEIEMLPSSYIKIDKDSAKQVLRLIETLEENEDVQHVWSNMDIPEDLLVEA